MISDVGPEPPFLHALPKPFVFPRAVQYPDRRIVRVQQVTAHNIGLNQLNQRLKGPHGSATPADKRALRDVRSHTGKDLVLAIERKVIVELRDQNMGQEVRPGHAPRDRGAGSWLLHNPFTAAAGLLDPYDLDHFHLGGNHIKEFSDIFAHHAQIAITVGAAGTRIKLSALTGCLCRDTRTAPQLGLRGDILGAGFVLPFVNGVIIVFGHCNKEILKRQLQLLDLAFNFFEDFPKASFCSLAIRNRRAWTS